MRFNRGAFSGSSGMHVVNECLIVPVQSDFDDATLEAMRGEVARQVSRQAVRGVLMDVSAVRVMDSFVFEGLVETVRMVALQGAEAVFVGFQPGVVSALMDLDVATDGLHTAVTMEDGLERLEQLMAHRSSVEEEEEQEEHEYEPEEGAECDQDAVE